MNLESKPYLVSRYPTEEEARTGALQHGIEEDGVYVRYFKGFNAGENTLVRDKGDIAHLSKTGRPSEMQELFDLQTQTQGWFVLYPNPEYRELFSEIKDLHKRARAHPRGDAYPPTDLWPAFGDGWGSAGR